MQLEHQELSVMMLIIGTTDWPRTSYLHEYYEYFGKYECISLHCFSNFFHHL